MNDPRLNSGHFEVLSRRQNYRRAREVLLGTRGWMTRAVECIHGFVEDSDDWPALMPIRPDQILPGTKFLLIDPQTTHHYPLQTGLNTIGRYPDNDIVLDPISVSRRHCVLLVHTWGGCELHDTASRNSTFVNDRRLQQPLRLNSGDRLKIGPVQLFFVREEDCPSGEPNPGYPDTAVLG